MNNNTGSTTSTQSVSINNDFATNRRNNQADICGEFLKRKVTVMDNMTTSIPCNKKQQDEKVTINSKNFKFSSLRGIFKIIKILRKPLAYIGLINKNPSVIIEKTPELNFTTTKNTAKKQVINLNIDDEILLKDIKAEAKSFTTCENGDILQQEISLLDVKQNDYRSSCYLLSSLASYANSELGKDLLKSMITPLGNKIQVTFIHEETNTKFNIVVDNTTLVDSSGNAIYSSSDADTNKWCMLIEKAYHGLRIFLKKTIQNYQDNDNEAVAAVVNSMLGVAPKNNSLDYANGVRAISFLPTLPQCNNIPENYQQTQNTTHYIFNEKDSVMQQRHIHTILTNAQHKVPMNLSSRKGKALQLAKHGIPTGHAMAVIGTASEKLTNGKIEPGILLYDPYGNPAPSKELLQQIINQDPQAITQIDNAASCIKFIRAKDITKYFAEAVITKGGFIKKL